MKKICINQNTQPHDWSISTALKRSEWFLLKLDVGNHVVAFQL